jgi:hypothetical protein
MGTLNRRDFLKDSAFLAAAMAGAGALRAAEPTEKKEKDKAGGGSDQLRVAVVGVHGQGMSHVGGYLNKDLNCTITTICDVDEGVIGRAMKTVEDKQGKAPNYEKDIRKVVEDKNIDVISIATPNHWHALAAIWALQNGKDVYVEKPVSHNISEGRRIVETARKLNRICQAGTQSRSGTGLREAMEFLHNGKLGKIKVSRGLCYKPRGSIGKVKGPQEPPKTMDYDLWCGPAPNKPPMRNGQHGTVHYDWHWIWDYGNGDLGNQGIHEMDKARWGLNKNELPKSVVSIGGRFGYVDDGETANTQVAWYDYGEQQIIFEVRGLMTAKKLGADMGTIFHCANGYMVVLQFPTVAIAYDLDGNEIRRWTGGTEESHFANFVSAVRSRRREDLKADILEGHLSCALCHLGNISYRLGQARPFEPRQSIFRDSANAQNTMIVMEEHLASNGVPLNSTDLIVGPRLTVNPASEDFSNNEPANRLLTREYRQGFAVPARV